MIHAAQPCLLAAGRLQGNLLLAEKEWIGLTVGSLWLALILVMLAAAIKLAKEFRRSGFGVLGIFAGHEADDPQDAHMSLTKFRELHARGGLSDDEYRTIHTKLASQIQGDAPASSDPTASTNSNPKSAPPAELAGDPPTADTAGPTVDPASDPVKNLTDEKG